jgi:hypothetical protein
MSEFRLERARAPVNGKNLAKIEAGKTVGAIFDRS